MRIFITGTDTNIGKTTVSSWLCLHSGYDYFKPIQTGSIEGRDSEIVEMTTNSKTYPEAYIYPQPVSPHFAAQYQNETIDISTILIPHSNNLIIEGAGGVLVPINKNVLIIDLIKLFATPVILVVSTKLGTINHSLLTIEALRSRNIPILGIIVNGKENIATNETIEFYGKVPILGQLPLLDLVNKETLQNIPLSASLRKIFEVNS